MTTAIKRSRATDNGKVLQDAFMLPSESEHVDRDPMLNIVPGDVSEASDAVKRFGRAYHYATSGADASTRHFKTGQYGQAGLTSQVDSVKDFSAKDFDHYMDTTREYIRVTFGDADPHPEDSWRYFQAVDIASRHVVNGNAIGMDAAMNMPYGLIVHHVFKMKTGCLKVDKTAASVEVRDGWEGAWDRIVRGLSVMGPNRMRPAEVEKIMDETAKSLRGPENVDSTTDRLKRRLKAATAAENAVTNGIDTLVRPDPKDKDGKPLTDDGAPLSNADNIMRTVETVLRSRGLAVPRIGADPATMSAPEAEIFATLMDRAGNVDAMKRMHTVLGHLLAKQTPSAA